MKKILLVEDEPIDSIDLRKILTQKGYNIVDRVATGENAINSFNEFNPDLIIMDIHLKGKMTGYDTAKELIQFSNPKFIFIASSEDYEEYLKGTGIDYVYLKKPFTEGHLLNLLKQFTKGEK